MGQLEELLEKKWERRYCSCFVLWRVLDLG